MSITQQLQAILQARYGRDVRQAIHDSIEDGYNIAVQAEGKAVTAEDSASASASAAAQSSAIALQAAQLAEQYKNEAFSGTPTGYEDLVNKVNSIYRETASDFASIGTSEGSALAHTIYGMSVQDGTPTPSVPVEIQSAKANFKCVGKNLIPYPYEDGMSKTINGITYTVNSDGSITAQGTATSNAYFFLDRNFKIKQGIYKGTLNVTGEAAATYVIRYYNDGEGWSYLFSINDNVTIPSDKIGALAVRVLSGQTVDLIFKPQLILATNSDLSYELNQHTDITTDLTLRAIEVASTDDYNLVRDGKYYIADTVDWSEDEGYQITRRIGHVIIDGSTPIASISGNTVQIMHTAFSQMRANLNVGYSNRFAHKSSNYTTGGDANTVLSSGEFSYRKGQVTTTANQRSIYLKNSDFTTTSNASTWFASNNTNITFVLETPTTESITSEQAQALLSLKTYDEATSISATGNIEPSLDLEYSKDRNTALALTGHNLAHKNALKLNDINTALIELGGN